MFQSATAPTTVNPENPIAVMQRCELKYILNREQIALLRRAMEGHMVVDQFGLTTIGSIYYDTPDRRLIRASLEKPEFKEKLRLRSYGPATEVSPVFLELKRKYQGIVYKRRVQTTVPEADAFLRGARDQLDDSQISRELQRFRDFYGKLEPGCLILYDRTAYVEPGGDLRLTIDGDPRYRFRELNLSRPEGTLLLPEGSAVLELKIQGAIPLWLSRTLNEAGIYQTSFSKVGAAYCRELGAETRPTERPSAVPAPSVKTRLAPGKPGGQQCAAPAI